MATYLKREISEWNTSDLSDWLIDNKYPGISELCQNNSISGYDLFYITDDILKNELGLNSFHERKVTMKLIKKLIYEHLKLNIINSNGDNVIITLDNNHNTSLGELSEYIGGMFNINPKDILYKDTSKTEVLSPSLKIVELLILYPRLYKTLNIFNMKDFYNNNEINENVESKNNEYNINMNNNSSREEMNESEYQKSNNNKNKNIKMNFDYRMERNNLEDENMNKMKNDMNNIKIKKEKFKMEEIDDNNSNSNRIIYNEKRNMKNNNKDIIYNNDEYDIRNKEEIKYYRRDKIMNERNYKNKENISNNYNEDNIEIKNAINIKQEILQIMMNI